MRCISVCSDFCMYSKLAIEIHIQHLTAECDGAPQ